MQKKIICLITTAIVFLSVVFPLTVSADEVTYTDVFGETFTQVIGRNKIKYTFHPYSEMGYNTSSLSAAINSGVDTDVDTQLRIYYTAGNGNIICYVFFTDNTRDAYIRLTDDFGPDSFYYLQILTSTNNGSSFSRTSNISSYDYKNTYLQGLISNLENDNVTDVYYEVYGYSRLPVAHAQLVEEGAAAPFTVSYSPSLSQEMDNHVLIPSKGGANADENGYVSQDYNVITATVQLTDEMKTYLLALQASDDLVEMVTGSTGSASVSDGFYTDTNSASFSVIGCITNDPLTDFTSGPDFYSGLYSHSLLYALDKQTYTATKNGNYTVAFGYSPIYTIPASGAVHLVFDVSHIDFDGLGISRTEPLYINIYGFLTTTINNGSYRISYGSSDMLSTSNAASIAPFETKTLSDNEDSITYYSQYTVSDSFMYESYPEYTPFILKDGNGNSINLSGATLSDVLDITPDQITDTYLISGMNEGNTLDDVYLSPDEYESNVHSRVLANNFTDTDFLTFDAITDTNSSYFQFLTYGLKLFPDWVYSVFATWFVIFLCFVLLKWIIS